jgi:hypothetical protein
VHSEPVAKRPVFWFALLLVLLLLTGIAIGSDRKGGNAPSNAPLSSHASTQGATAAKAPSSADPRNTAKTASAESLSTWVARHVDLLQELVSDFSRVSLAAREDDFGAARAACQQLHNDVGLAQATEHIPQPVDQQAWATALRDYSSGASECVNGVEAQNTSLIGQAEADMLSGTTALRRLDSGLGGNLGIDGLSGASGISGNNGNSGTSGNSGNSGSAGNSGNSG